MLKLSGILKSRAFELEDSDGKLHSLKAMQYSVSDTMKLIELQAPVAEMKDGATMVERNEILQTSRVVCSVKKEDGGYFWNSTDEFRNKNYPNELLDELANVVLELNPYPVAVDEKKSKS